MLIEIHMLQNHAPSNLNRDDTGSPKECTFGGIKRGRISSQCIKRSIRRSAVFAEELGHCKLATRTRRLPLLVKEKLIAAGLSGELAAIAAEKATGFGNKEGKTSGNERTKQTMFLTEHDIDALVTVLKTAAEEAGTPAKLKKVSAKDLQKAAELGGWRPITVDMALFGRMITSPAFTDVEASMQVAHAISTNRIDHEFDYFTAADDLQGVDEDDDEAGADMIGDVEFNSACYYKYFTLDTDAFIANLARHAPGEAETEARRAAAAAIPAFVKAAIFTSPSGKQNTFAAHQLPDAILIEVRPHKTPVSYANAFVKPALANGSADLVDDSIQKFVQHADTITRKFSLKTMKRLWFSTRDQKLASTEEAAVTECETVDDLLNALRALLPGGEASDV